MDKELLTIIIAPLIVGAIWYYQDYKSKKKEKQQARLNQIKVKDNQFEIDANGTETKKDSVLWQ